MRLLKHFQGDGLRGRATRGVAISLGTTAAQQLIRLGSNLILTRLLFPEAFGLMALVQTFMTGLAMFSDLGIGPSIIQNRRGEDPDFLNTAWTIQIGRGVILWLGACALALPAAEFYDEPLLLWLLPVVGLTALIAGFQTTKTMVANRQLRLGRQAVLDLATQSIGILVMISLAWIWPSVWALVIGGLVSSLVGMLAGHLFMPGVPNRLRWDRSAAYDLLHFGKYIFLSSLAGFVVVHSDKMLMGRLVGFGDLGVYNIAFFMAGFPGMLAGILAERILFPLYREIRPSESALNRRRIGQARSLLVGTTIAMFGVLALVGDWLIGLLYDPRYAAAGPMMIVLALMSFPGALTRGNSQLLLAEGNSRDFSKLTLIQAVLILAYMFAGFWFLGMFGILLASGLTAASIYPLQQYFLSRHHGTDLRRDALFTLAVLALSGLAIWVNWEVLRNFVLTSHATAPFVTGSWTAANVFGGTI
ncbi:oligosaccharide flippase family protein [Paracoccus sp. MC1854]|uniref:oligosaccharide flippase family protein n=1 Tax=Paracoccus sp. MC1854 TaxID=2760306 RepID=UPI0016021E84|nr:oligosaccharide flippase family protein [Paracoccus sp. MC1854]MBB1492644.1 oligosaccharide flippase family protein [Paracoccus sp. MC1854]